MTTAYFSQSFKARRKLYRRQLAALRASIGKWEDIVYNGGEDKGTQNCQLCAEFYETRIPDVGYLKRCLLCPVNESKKHTGCQDTPYTDWSSYMYTAPNNPKRPNKRLMVFDEKSGHLASMELKFLGTLYKNWLTKGKEQNYLTKSGKVL